MVWIEIVTAIALLEYLAFGYYVGWARGKFGVKAPAAAGHEIFERYYRVQMNTVELLIAFLPALWLAARYFSPYWMAGIGAVYIVGRVVYFRAYTRDPATRSLGYALSMVPIAVLLIGGLAGAIRAAFA